MGPRKNQKLEYVYRFYEKGKLAKEFEIHIAMGKWRRKSQMVRPLSHNSRHRHWIYSFYVLVMYVTAIMGFLLFGYVSLGYKKFVN